MRTQKWTAEASLNQEETLDPNDWKEFRKLGYRMLDDKIDYLATRREQPVWQAMPESVRTSFAEPLPGREEELWFHVDGALGRWRGFRTNCARCWRESKRRIRWRLTCTSGCICRSKWDAFWCGIKRHIATRSRISRVI